MHLLFMFLILRLSGYGRVSIALLRDTILRLSWIATVGFNIVDWLIRSLCRLVSFVVF